MWFGQRLFTRDGRTVHGKWRPYPTRGEAIADGCQWVSVLELACSVQEFRRWEADLLRRGEEPARHRPAFSFRGSFYADFDAPEGEARKSVAHLQRQLADCLLELCRRLDLDPRQPCLWFSGSKGFHLLLSSALFSRKEVEHPRLPTVYKIFCRRLGLADLADMAVYSEGRGRLWRVEGCRRANGCHKMPLTLAQLDVLGLETIRKRSRTPPTPTGNPKPVFCPKLARIFEQALAEIDEREAAVTKVAPKAESREDEPLAPWSEEWQSLETVLAQLPPGMVESYDGWLRVGMVLHQASGGTTEGLRLWNRWSRVSAKYDATVQDQKWQSFNTERENGLTLASLFYWARNPQA